MKRIIAFVLSLALMTALCLSVEAEAKEYEMEIEHIVGGDSSDVTASTQENELQWEYTASERYVVTIPQGIEFTSEITKIDKEISLKDVDIRSGRVLKIITFSSNYSEGWNLVNLASDEQKVGYSISIGEMPVLNESLIISCASGKASMSETLSFALSGDVPVAAGSYVDRLTFRVSITDAT